MGFHSTAYVWHKMMEENKVFVLSNILMGQNGDNWGYIWGWWQWWWWLTRKDDLALCWQGVCARHPGMRICVTFYGDWAGKDGAGNMGHGSSWHCSWWRLCRRVGFLVFFPKQNGIRTHKITVESYVEFAVKSYIQCHDNLTAPSTYQSSINERRYKRFKTWNDHWPKLPRWPKLAHVTVYV